MDTNADLDKTDGDGDGGEKVDAMDKTNVKRA